MVENDKYPQLILGTDNLYKILISKDVELQFNSRESIETFCKDKNFNIIGYDEKDRVERVYQ